MDENGEILLLHASKNKARPLVLPWSLYTLKMALFESWSSLDKGETVACQIASPSNKKIGCFERQSFKFHLKNNPAYC